jgi:hypothetical protein
MAASSVRSAVAMLILGIALARGTAAWADERPSAGLDDWTSLLALQGIQRDQFSRLLDETPLSANERALVLRVALALARWPTWQLERAAREAGELGRLDSMAPPAAGAAVRFQGRLRRAVALPLDAELSERFGLQEIYECDVELEKGRSAIVYTLEIPKAWRLDQDLNEPVAGLGVFLKLGSPPPEAVPLLACARLTWHPATLLGRLGMDVGLLDRIEQKRRLGAEEREAFYGLLAAVGRSSQRELCAAAENQAVDQDQTIIDLFQEPQRHVGQVVRLRATARRAVRIEVNEAELQSQYGLDHYYEVELVLHVANLAPHLNPVVVVLCLRELPSGMSTGGDLRQAVSVCAVFFKLWAYESQYANQAGADMRQIAPLLIGRTLARESAPSAPTSATGILLLGAAALIGLVAGVVWWFNASDRRRRF